MNIVIFTRINTHLKKYTYLHQLNTAEEGGRFLFSFNAPVFRLSLKLLKKDTFNFAGIEIGKAFFYPDTTIIINFYQNPAKIDWSRRLQREIDFVVDF